MADDSTDQLNVQLAQSRDRITNMLAQSANAGGDPTTQALFASYQIPGQQRPSFSDAFNAQMARKISAEEGLYKILASQQQQNLAERKVRVSEGELNLRAADLIQRQADRAAALNDRHAKLFNDMVKTFTEGADKRQTAKFITSLADKLKQNPDITDLDAWSMAGTAAGESGLKSKRNITFHEVGNRVVGLDAETGDIIKDVGPAPPPKALATVTLTQEKAESQGVGSGLAKEYSDIGNRADVAANTIDQVTLARKISAPTGRLASAKETMGGFLEALGANSKAVKDAKDLQAFNAIASNYVLGKQLEQKGVQTESDARRMEQTFANTKNIDAANDMILRAVSAQSNRTIEQYRFYRAYRSANGTLDGAGDQWRAFIQQTPIVYRNPQTGSLLFYDEFAKIKREENPNISEGDIVAEWRKHNK